MLTIEQIDALRETLRKLLALLQSREIYCIEYGDPTKPVGSYMSYLRIYYINTIGGLQFGIKRLDRRGVEGSGHYLPDAKQAEDAAMNCILHYHRPTKFTEELRKRREERNETSDELSFFAIVQEQEMQNSITHRNALVAYSLKDLKLGGAAIKLELPDQKLINQAYSLYAKWLRISKHPASAVFDIFVLQVTDGLGDEEARALSAALKKIHAES